MSKSNSGFKGITFKFKNDSNGFVILSIKGNGFVPITIEFQNKKVLLERELTGIEKVLSFIPLLIFGLLVILFGGMGGIIGGAFVGISIVLSLFISSSLIRQEISKGILLVYLFLLGVIMYSKYFIVTLVFAFLMGGMISAIL